MRFVSLLAASVLLAAPLRAVAFERGAAAGTAVTSRVTVESRLAVDDVTGHALLQSSADEQLATPDRIAGVAFDGARVHTVSQADVADGAGVVRGYSTWEARTGEKLFVAFGYSVPPRPPGAGGSRFEGTFEWLGGSGPLGDLKGKGTIEGEINAAGERRYRWAGQWGGTP